MARSVSFSRRKEVVHHRAPNRGVRGLRTSSFGLDGRPRRRWEADGKSTGGRRLLRLSRWAWWSCVTGPPPLQKRVNCSGRTDPDASRFRKTILMSLPTKQLQKLQIQGRMPTTRSQAHREHREQQEQTRYVGTVRSIKPESAMEGSGPSAGEGSGQSPSPSSSPGEKSIRGLSGHTYDCRQLSPVSRSRALEGMNADIDVAQCREINGYYAFEIPERASVRIGPPQGPYANPTCSCSDFQNRKSACKHIYVRAEIPVLGPMLTYHSGCSTICVWSSHLYTPPRRY